MKWLEIRITYESQEMEVAKEVLGNLFHDFGVRGVKLDEPMGNDELDYYSDEKMRFFKEYAVTGYFPINNYLESKKALFLNKLKELVESENIIYEIFYNELDETEWEESWKKYFNPEKITPNITVKPTWKEYTPSEGEVIIDIDPGMAFGTGTHPTTFLCINMIEKYIKPGMNFLDVGTGSGILMIAAAKTGAEKVLGVDIDEVAVEVAKQNLELNKIGKDKYTVLKGDLLEIVKEEKFDMVASNILAEIIVILLDDIKKVLKKDGIFISSGIISEKADIVERKLKACGIELIEKVEKEGWVSIVGRLV